MVVDTRYWCVDDQIDWAALRARNSAKEPLLLPPSLESETAAFREELVSRCGCGDAAAITSSYALELVIAAILTTQCRNGRSLLVFRELCSIASERGSWAELTLVEIARLTKPLGFTRRAHHVLAATRVSRGAAEHAARLGVTALVTLFAGVGEKCGTTLCLQTH